MTIRPRWYSTDLAKHIRGMVDLPLSNEQVQEIQHRAFTFDGEGLVQTVTPDEFWMIVEELTA